MSQRSDGESPLSDPERVVQRGLWFEEFTEGTIYEHRPGRTVTEADNVLFTTLTMNTQALHLDAAWSAQQPGFGGQRLINSMFTLSTIVGLSVSQLTQGKKNLDICDNLCLSPKTVSTYRHRLYEKLDVETDVELTHLALRHGIKGPGC